MTPPVGLSARLAASLSACAARCYEPLLGRVLASLRVQAAQCCAAEGGTPEADAGEGRTGRTGRRGRALDVCCGPGGLRPYLEQRGFTVAGVDMDAPMLREARRRQRAESGCRADALWVQADARSLPFADGCFDVAVVCLALHAMPWDSATAVLAHMRRVARRVVIADYCLPERNMALPGCRVAFAVERLVGGEHYRCYREFMRRGGLEGLLHSEGVSVARREYALGGAAMITLLLP